MCSKRHRGLIANPNCSTMQMIVALAPIHRAVGIERLIVSTYQSVSGTGKKAVDELESQAHASLHGMEMPAPEIYPEPIAFNVIGAAGNFADGDDHTDEERKMMFETRKILEDRVDRRRRHLRPRPRPGRPLGVGQRPDARADLARGASRPAQPAPGADVEDVPDAAEGRRTATTCSSGGSGATSRIPAR